MKTNFIVVGLIGGGVSAFVAPRQVAAPCVSRTALFSAKARAKHQQKQQKDDSAKFIEQGINEFNATGEVELESFRTSSNLAPLFLKDEKTDEVSPSAISDASPAAESGQEETILKVIENQLIGSSMIYTFAKVRTLVRDTLDQHDWYRPELILTRGVTSVEKDTSLKAITCISGDGSFTKYNKYLKYPITADAIYKFISDPKNKRLLSKHLKQGDFDIDQSKELFPNVLEALERFSNIDGDVIEFDDQFHTQECVYTLTVNRSNKRLTVCFRGSANIHNWRYNFWIHPKQYLNPPPKVLSDIGFEGNIGLHKGFDSYLMETCKNGDIKFDDIVGQIREVYANPKYKDYDLYVTGHSLGGALSTLLSFYLVSTGKLADILNNKAVTNISFASPRTGNDDYDKAFQALEAKGLLRHLRISNNGDLAPTFPQIFGFTHTGINLLLYKKKQLFINNNHSLLRGHFWNPFEYLDNHSLKEHYQRLEIDENHDLLSQYETFNQIYKENFPKSQ